MSYSLLWGSPECERWLIVYLSLVLEHTDKEAHYWKWAVKFCSAEWTFIALGFHCFVWVEFWFLVLPLRFLGSVESRPLVLVALRACLAGGQAPAVQWSVLCPDACLPSLWGSP